MALRTLTTIAAGPIVSADDSGKLVSAIHANDRMIMEVALGDEVWGLASSGTARVLETISSAKGSVDPRDVNLNSGSALLQKAGRLHQALAGSLLLRLEPDALRTKTQLIPEGEPVRFFSANDLDKSVRSRDMSAPPTEDAATPLARSSRGARALLMMVGHPHRHDGAWSS